MIIEYGEEENVERKVYQAGVIKRSENISRYSVREQVKDDQDELAKFIQFQREAKGSKDASFIREFRENGNRYIVKGWTV